MNECSTSKYHSTRKLIGIVATATAMLAIAGAVASLVAQGPTALFGALTVTGIGFTLFSQMNQRVVDSTKATLQADKSAGTLVKSIEGKGVSLTPEQRDAIYGEEHAENLRGMA